MKIQINGLSVRYEEAGSGKVLVFLHGWGGRWESWYPVFYPLSKKYRVLALDLPGFGETEKSKETWGISEYANFVNDFIKTLGLKEITLIGHSFGGAIAIKSKCTKLVLVDASGIRRKNSNPLLLFKSFPIPQNVRNLFRSEDYKQAGEMREIFKKVVTEDLSKDLSKISVPTLIIWGEKDRDTPLSDGKIFNNQIKGSVFKMFTNCGHFSYLEKPEEFYEAVEEFVGLKNLKNYYLFYNLKNMIWLGSTNGYMTIEAFRLLNKKEN